MVMLRESTAEMSIRKDNFSNSDDVGYICCHWQHSVHSSAVVNRITCMLQDRCGCQRQGPSESDRKDVCNNVDGLRQIATQDLPGLLLCCSRSKSKLSLELGVCQILIQRPTESIHPFATEFSLAIGRMSTVGARR